MVVVAACRFNAGTRILAEDASIDDDGGPADAAVPSCGPPLPWDRGLAPVRTLYVAANAAGGGDGSQPAPFQTIAAAAAVATPGTRILLAAGSYPPETLDSVHGIATAPIWIEGPAVGARATFTGSYGLRLHQPQYVVLRHLDFSTISTTAISADDNNDRSSEVAHHLAISDVTVTDAVTTAFQLSGVYDVAIDDATATRVSRGVQMVGVHRAMITRLSVMTAMYSILTSGGSTEIEIRDGHFVDGGVRVFWIGGDSTPAEFRPPLVAGSSGNYEAANVRVINNIIEDGNAFVTCDLCSNVLVAANFVRGTQLGYVFRFIQTKTTLAGAQFVTTASTRVIDNAIEVANNPYGARVESGASCGTCVFDHNLWFESDNPPGSHPPLPVPETNGIYEVPSGYNAAGLLCAGGAAIAKGVRLPEVDGTREGACRPDPPSIGPNEPGGC